MSAKRRYLGILTPLNAYVTGKIISGERGSLTLIKIGQITAASTVIGGIAAPRENGLENTLQSIVQKDADASANAAAASISGTTDVNAPVIARETHATAADAADAAKFDAKNIGSLFSTGILEKNPSFSSLME